MTRRLPRDSLVLIDSNLAILLCVGLSGAGNIKKHKRLASFDSHDFDLLEDLLSTAAGLVFSPYVLSETSNLVRQTGDPLKRELSIILKRLVLGGSEIQMQCVKIVEDSHCLFLGMTDAALLSILDAHPNILLLTVDLDLYLAAAARGHDTINFTHVRDQRPDYR